MIAAGAFVWVDHLNDTLMPQVERLRDTIANRRAPLLVSDLVLCEVLQGPSSEREAILVERTLRRFVMEPMVSPALLIGASIAHSATLLDAVVWAAVALGRSSQRSEPPRASRCPTGGRPWSAERSAARR